MKVLPVFLLTFIVAVCLAKVNYDEELVVQLIDRDNSKSLLQHIPHFVKSKINLVPYYEEKVNSPAEKELSRFFLIENELHDDEKIQLRDSLLKLNYVTACYIKPKFENAVYEEPTAKDIKPLSTASDTPLFKDKQTYLKKAPGGVHAKAAQKYPGGDGEGITVYDVEQGFNFKHEDLIQHNGSVLIGRAIPSSRHHGAAVCGIISGFKNSFGVTGIAHKAKINGCSFHYENSRHPRVGPAIAKCSTFAKKGDVILLEMHAIGPNRKYIAMDWWPDNHAAIKFAVQRGLVVVGAGGNGGENLDNEIYNKPLVGFPRDWKNPFDRENGADSGGIFIGAGAPPPGTNGRNHGNDRSRLGFSNYGKSVDAQGWGREVVSIGYGDLFNKGENRLYTSTFSGTSSASPVVVGTIAAIQGILKKKNRNLLTSKQVRDLLRKTGSPQVDETGRPKSQRIGNRPDLKQMVKEILKE